MNFGKHIKGKTNKDFLDLLTSFANKGLSVSAAKKAAKKQAQQKKKK